MRTALLGAASIPVIGWLLGWFSETADAIGSLLIPAIVLTLISLLPLGRRASMRHYVTAGLLILVAASAMVPDFVARLNRAPAGGAAERLVVVTHNVLVGNTAPEATVAALLAEDADVLMLQEVDGTFAAMLPRLRAHYGWSSACAKECSLAIFSRFPIDRVRYRLRDRIGAAYGPPLVQTVMRLPGRQPIPLLTIHLPWPVPPGPQRRLRRALADAVTTIDARRAILAGDFNLVAWSHGMRRLDAGMAPLARATRLLPTFPARVRGISAIPMLPIDHLFAGPGWQVEEVRRTGRTGSDHFGVRVVLVARAAGNGRPAMAWRADRDRG